MSQTRTGRAISTLMPAATLWLAIDFSNLPDAAVHLAALVIAGAGLYVWHRETRGGNARR